MSATKSTENKDDKSEIKLDSNTKVKVSEVDADQDDQQFLDAIKKKGQLAILKDTNHYICNLKLKMMEDILKKMGTNLSDEINLIAFGIYSMEEINKIKSKILEVAPIKFENVARYLEIKEPELIRINANEKKMDNNIFINIQEKLDFIKAEEERKRKEEEERKKKLEEENRIKMKIKEEKRERAKLKLKQIRQDNIKEILMKKFTQYRNNINSLKIVETSTKKETEKKVLRLKIKKEPKNKIDEEAEKKKKEEEEKKRLEEEERKRKEEEEERKRKEEEERKRKEEEEKKRIKEEEEKKRKEEEEKKRLEEEARKKKEEEEKEKERIKLEEEARKKKEEEENEKQILLQEKLIYQKEEEEKLLKEKEEEEKLLKEKEEEEKRRLELEKLKPNIQEKSIIESVTTEIREEITSPTMRGTDRKSDEENNVYNNINTLNTNIKDNNIDNINTENNNIENNIIENNNKEDKDNKDNNINKIDEETKIKEEKEKESSQNEDSNIKPKKKKVIKKVKKIVKIPKKKVDKVDIIDNRKPFYISGSTSVSGGGIGHFHENIAYTGRIPKCHFSSTSQCDCGNCHNKYNKEKITQINNNNIYPNKKEKNNNDLLICENCVHKLNQYDENNNLNNNGNKNIHIYEYYQNIDDGKYDPINTKEFYEMNRNRYLSELWKKENEGVPYGKKGIKSKSIEKVKKTKINDDDFDRYINGFTTERYGINRDNSEFNGNNDDKNYNNANRVIKRCRNNSTEVRKSYRINGNNENNINNINNVRIINGMNNLDEENDGNTYLNNRTLNLRIRKNQYYNDNGDLNNNLNNDENNNTNNKNNKIIINNNIIYRPESKELDCPLCKNSYVITKEIRFYHCSDCKNIMCGKCSKDHYIRYPEHNCSNTDINGIITNASYEYNNINNKKTEINKSPVKETKKRKLNVRKYINKSQNQNQNQENNINNNINNEALNLENNNNNNNNDILLLRNKKENNIDYNNIINNYENGGDYNYEDCYLCGIKQREYIQDKFYICRECDRLLCQNCKIKHDKINPEHNLIISYISGEINNGNKDINNNLEQISQYQCIHCQNRINNNINAENIRYNINGNENININNEDTNNINNSMNIKLRKEKINQNIQSMQIIQNIKSNTLENNNNKTNISSQFENNNYPNDNEDTNMKTQYQHDYDDKYNLYRNLMNSSNEKKKKENNDEYFNPIKEYENIQEIKNMNNNNTNINVNINQRQNLDEDYELLNNNNKNITPTKIKRNAYYSPLKKKKLIKNNMINLENNEQNDYNGNDQYNKETINDLNIQLKDKNIDLIKKRKCKIEFDFNKDEKEFDTCEIFGNPVCYNCLKGKKDEKYFKLFYCSQCMKLFCKDCLYQHNYI